MAGRGACPAAAHGFGCDLSGIPAESATRRNNDNLVDQGDSCARVRVGVLAHHRNDAFFKGGAHVTRFSPSCAGDGRRSGDWRASRSARTTRDCGRCIFGCPDRSGYRRLDGGGLRVRRFCVVPIASSAFVSNALRAPDANCLCHITTTTPAVDSAKGTGPRNQPR